MVRNGPLRRFSVECLELEYPPQKCPNEWKIGHNHGRARFSDVPVRPLRSEWMREGVIFVQNSSEDDEDSQTEDAGEDEFSAPR